MRDFFIKALDVLIGIMVVLMIIGVVIAAGSMMMGGAIPGSAVSGPVGGLIVLVVGLLYVCFMAGFMYLGLGIYHNTKRTADALANRG